jgi:hypothetical protein
MVALQTRSASFPGGDKRACDAASGSRVLGRAGGPANANDGNPRNHGRAGSPGSACARASSPRSNRSGASGPCNARTNAGGPKAVDGRKFASA